MKKGQTGKGPDVQINKGPGDFGGGPQQNDGSEKRTEVTQGPGREPVKGS